MRNILYFLFIIVITSCNSDDKNDGFNPCDLDSLINVKIIDGVEQRDFVISEYNDGYRGYLVTSTIVNNNDFDISGESVYVIKINGRIGNYLSELDCVEIPANSTCDYERTIFAESGESNDPKAKLLCFYYME